MHTFGVQMVGGFVQKQYVWFLKKQATQRHPTSFTTREHTDFHLWKRGAQSVHGNLQFSIQFPGINRIYFILKLSLFIHQGFHFVWILIHLRQSKGLVDFVVAVQNGHHLFDPLFYHLQNGFIRVQFRFLIQKTHGISWGKHHVTLVVLILSCNNF